MHTLLTFVFISTRKLPSVRNTTREFFFRSLLSLTRKFPGPRSSQFPATNVNNLLLTSITFVSFSSPVNVFTSSYFRFWARLSSYTRATSLRFSTLASTDGVPAVSDWALEPAIANNWPVVVEESAGNNEEKPLPWMDSCMLEKALNEGYRKKEMSSLLQWLVHEHFDQTQSRMWLWRSEWLDWQF